MLAIGHMIKRGDPRLADLPVVEPGAWPKAEDYADDIFGMPVLSPGRLDFFAFETETIPSEDPAKPWDTSIVVHSLRLVQSFRLAEGDFGLGGDIDEVRPNLFRRLGLHDLKHLFGFGKVLRADLLNGLGNVDAKADAGHGIVEPTGEPRFGALWRVPGVLYQKLAVKLFHRGRNEVGNDVHRGFLPLRKGGFQHVRREVTSGCGRGA